MSASSIGASENLYMSSVAEKAEAEAKNAANDRVDRQDFMELLIAQLTNQDPMKPMDNEQFIQQLAQLQSLEEQIETNDILGAMQTGNELADASSFIGMYVTGVNTMGDITEGVVGYARMEDGTAYLNLSDGSEMKLSDIFEVDMPMVSGEGG